MDASCQVWIKVRCHLYTRKDELQNGSLTSYLIPQLKLAYQSLAERLENAGSPGEEKYCLGQETEGQRAPSMRACKPREQDSKRPGLCNFWCHDFTLGKQGLVDFRCSLPHPSGKSLLLPLGGVSE